MYEKYHQIYPKKGKEQNHLDSYDLILSTPLPAHFDYLEDHVFDSNERVNATLRGLLKKCPEINQAIMNILKSKNFIKTKEIGSGCTRTASEFKKEDPKTGFEQRVVVKIPHDTVDPDSVTSLINNSKGDMNIKEIRALNEIDHENIVKIIDAFEVNYHDLILNEPGESWRKDARNEWLSQVKKCSKVVTIESYFESKSLEDDVNEDGPITDLSDFSYIFKKLLAGLEYLHTKKSMVHRDIKPSNILIGKDNVKITDLQNAAKLEDITEQALPTRGGTAHTDLRILDAFLAGKESCASVKSDLYALGTTMYFAYTGKNLFDFDLKVDKASEKAVDINGRKIGYVFKKNNVPVTSLDLKALDKEIKKKLKVMPFSYRKMMYNLISPFSTRYQGNAEQIHKQLKYDFVNASTMYHRLKRLAKRIMMSAIFIPIAYYTGSAISNAVNSKETSAVLDSNGLHSSPVKLFDETGFRMDQNTLENNLYLEKMDFNRQCIEAEADLESAVKKHSDFIGPGENFIEQHCPKEHKRLLYSIIRSVLSSGRGFAGNYDICAGVMESQVFYPFEKENRFPVTMLPESFVIEQISNRLDINASAEEINKAADNANIMFAHECIPMAVARLKKAIKSARSSRNSLIKENVYVEDIITEYFGEPCVHDLIKSVPGRKFYPQIFRDAGIISVIGGYGSSLPLDLKDLISRAIIFYCASDNEGNIDFSRLNRNEIAGNSDYVVNLPVSVDWRVLKLDNSNDSSTGKK